METKLFGRARQLEQQLHQEATNGPAGRSNEQEEKPEQGDTSKQFRRFEKKKM